jgi:hypothetical protein
MRLNVKAEFHVTISAALFWGLMLSLIVLAVMIWSSYGQAFFDLVAPVYPDYEARPSFGQAIVGLLYGMLAGAIGGAVFAWLSNRSAAVDSEQA